MVLVWSGGCVAFDLVTICCFAVLCVIICWRLVMIMVCVW